MHSTTWPDPCQSHDADVASRQVLEVLGQLRAGQQAILECLAGRVKAHYTVEEVAALTGRSPYTVRRWLKEQKIAAIRVCGTGARGRLLIPRDALAKLIDAGHGGKIPAAVGSISGRTPTPREENTDKIIP
jgi:excisionase family DNA binding protein